jgi:hypothetical protein
MDAGARILIVATRGADFSSKAASTEIETVSARASGVRARTSDSRLQGLQAFGDVQGPKAAGLASARTRAFSARSGSAAVNRHEQVAEARPQTPGSAATHSATLPIPRAQPGGREAILELMRRYPEAVLHGSPNGDIEEFTPRFPKRPPIREITGEPIDFDRGYVWATPSVDVAIFCATVRGRGRAGWRTEVGDDREVSYIFGAAPATIARVLGSDEPPGYVYVFVDSGFSVDPDIAAQYRTDRPVRAAFKVEVTARDLWPPMRSLPNTANVYDPLYRGDRGQPYPRIGAQERLEPTIRDLRETSLPTRRATWARLLREAPVEWPVQTQQAIFMRATQSVGSAPRYRFVPNGSPLAERATGGFSYNHRVPVEMLRTSDLGYPDDKEVRFETPDGEQRKPAGAAGYLALGFHQGAGDYWYRLVTADARTAAPQGYEAVE